MRAGRALRRAVRCGVAGRAHGRLGNRPAVRRWGWAESDSCLDWRAGARRRVVTHAVDVIFGERMAIKPHGDEHRSYGRKGALGSLDGGGPPPSKLCPASHEAGYAVPPFTWGATMSRLSRGGLRCPAFYVGGFSVPPLTRRATMSRLSRGGLRCPATMSRLSRGGLRCPAFYVVGFSVPPLTRRATPSRYEGAGC
jgi:hypothetical protein